MGGPTVRFLTCFWLLLSAVGGLPRVAGAQFLCSAGLRDGLTCEGDADCIGGGVCVIPQGVCESSPDQLELCSCAGSICAAGPVCGDDPTIGTCSGGVFQDFCCDLAFNCSNGSNCIATQKLCIGGELRGFPCIEDDNCPGAPCRSTGGYCGEGESDSYSCVDADDCLGAECLFAGPTPTPRPVLCAGDCNRDSVVTVDELLTGVNMILLSTGVDACPDFDVDVNGIVTIDELISGVQSVLRGCAR